MKFQLSLLLALVALSCPARADLRDNANSCEGIFKKKFWQQSRQENRTRVITNLKLLVEETSTPNKYNYKELARAIDISYAAMTSYLNLRSTLPIKTALKIAELYKVSVYTILGDARDGGYLDDEDHSAENDIILGDNVARVSARLLKMFTRSLSHEHFMQISIGAAKILGQKPASDFEIQRAIHAYLVSNFNEKGSP